LYDSQTGIYFSGSSCLGLGNLLDILPTVTGMNQMILFLQLLKEMSETISKRVISSVDPIDFTNDALNDVSRIDKVISYLNKNYNQPVNLEEVSSLAAMNPSAFCRFFKNKTGKSFKNYILDMRIEYACKLLIMDNMSVSQVSAECGFDTISHFNKTFKKNTGYNPSQYKLIMLNDSNNHM
jgi:AraC-like DNA-binding protein